MVRIGMIAAVLLLFAGAAEARDAGRGNNSTVSAQRQLRLAVDDAEAGHYADAERRAAAIVDSETFSNIEPPTQLWARRMLGYSQVYQHKYAEALEQYQHVVRAAGASGDDWGMLFWAANGAEDHSESVRALTVLALNYPDDLRNFDDRSVFQALRFARSLDDDARRARLVAVLISSNWRPSDPAIDLTWLRLDYVRDLTAAGRMPTAVASARTMLNESSSDIRWLIMFFIDKSFDPVIAADPTFFTFEAASAKQIDNLRTLAGEHPNQLSVLNALAMSHVDRGQYEEALTIADAALARLQGAQGSGGNFEDADDATNWTYEVRAQALSGLGRYDEALDARSRGARTPENGQANVSQLLNGALFYVSLGRAEDALKELSYFDAGHASGYGRMVGLEARTCAHAMLSDMDAARADLAEMQSHFEDSPLGVAHAALCLNDSDAAANAFIRALNMSDSAQEAEVQAQHFTVRPPAPSEFETMMRQREENMLARADVQAALAQRVHVRSFPVQPQ